MRIKNGTYGICSVTGKLISKERLIAVPHTTQSIEAKLMQQGIRAACSSAMLLSFAGAPLIVEFSSSCRELPLV